MKKALILAILLSVSLFAQQTNKEQLVDSLFSIKGYGDPQEIPADQMINGIMNFAQKITGSDSSAFYFEVVDSGKSILNRLWAMQLQNRGMQNLYCELFTEGEIQDMIAFYNSPTGKKQLQVMSKLETKRVELATSFLDNFQVVLINTTKIIGKKYLVPEKEQQ